MKKWAIFLFLALPIHSQAARLDCSATLSPLGDQTLNLVKSLHQNIIHSAKMEMSNYFYDDCSITKKHTTTLFSSFSVSSNYSICQDGSTSFEQPDSTGYLDWNGFCGETATSNVLSMTCGKKWHPDGIIHSMAADYTPGTRPSTLESVLNELSPDSNCGGKTWSYYDTAEHGDDYIESIVNGLKSNSKFTRTRSNGTKLTRAPVMTLVKMKGSKTLHWMTIVDIVGYDSNKSIYDNPNCFAYANQWDDQYKIPCSDLAVMARTTEDVYGGMVGKYVRIKQVD